jgi:hypothetical protein
MEMAPEQYSHLYNEAVVCHVLWGVRSKCQDLKGEGFFSQYILVRYCSMSQHIPESEVCSF